MTFQKPTEQQARHNNKQKKHRFFYGGSALGRVGVALIGLLVISILPAYTSGSSTNTLSQVAASSDQQLMDLLPPSLDMDEYAQRSMNVFLQQYEADYTPFDEKIYASSDDMTAAAEDTDERTEHIDFSDITEDGSTVYVKTGGTHVRTKPSSDSDVVATLAYADKVERISYGTAWSHIRLSDETEGYVLSTFLSIEIIATTDVVESPMSGTFYSIGVVNVRSGPGTHYAITRTLRAGDPVEVVAKTSNGWYKSIIGTYVYAPLVIPSEQTAITMTVTPISPDGKTLAEYAGSFIGMPYKFGATGPSSFDCSGFVIYIYRTYYGFTFPNGVRSSYHIADPDMSGGILVSAEGIRAGDIVCYDIKRNGKVDHVALYIGSGRIIHASSSRRGIVEGSFSTQGVVAIMRFI